MRYVMSGQEVCHAFANQTQDHARRPDGRIFFEKDRIYSYGHHFCMARFVRNAAGIRKLLFVNYSYSSSTSGHLSHLRRATNHIDKIYCHDPEGSHEQNFNDWRSSIEVVASALPSAKKPEIHLSRIDAITNEAKAYADFFGIPIPADLALAMSISGKESYKGYAAAKEKHEKDAERKRLRLAKKAHKDALAKWLKFELHTLYSRDGRDYLRYNSEEKRFETSQGVKIPFEVARRTFKAVEDGTLAVGDKVLDYTVDHVNGDVKIGCHCFPKDYLLTFKPYFQS